MDILLENIFSYIEKSQEICESFPVKKLFFFGTVCTDQFHATSDIDLLVEWTKSLDNDETMQQLQNELEDLFAHKVNLRSNEMESSILQEKINSTKQLFYDRESQPISEEHKNILQQRYNAYKNDPQAGDSWENVKQRLEKKYDV